MMISYNIRSRLFQQKNLFKVDLNNNKRGNTLLNKK